MSETYILHWTNEDRDVLILRPPQFPGDKYVVEIQTDEMARIAEGAPHAEDGRWTEEEAMAVVIMTLINDKPLARFAPTGEAH
jgi:hypothetical protein